MKSDFMRHLDALKRFRKTKTQIKIYEARVGKIDKDKKEKEFKKLAKQYGFEVD